MQRPEKDPHIYEKWFLLKYQDVNGIQSRKKSSLKDSAGIIGSCMGRQKKKKRTSSLPHFLSQMDCKTKPIKLIEENLCEVYLR